MSQPIPTLSWIKLMFLEKNLILVVDIMTIHGPPESWGDLTHWCIQFKTYWNWIDPSISHWWSNFSLSTKKRIKGVGARPVLFATFIFLKMYVEQTIAALIECNRCNELFQPVVVLKCLYSSINECTQMGKKHIISSCPKKQIQSKKGQHNWVWTFYPLLSPPLFPIYQKLVSIFPLVTFQRSIITCTWKWNTTYNMCMYKSKKN